MLFVGRQNEKKQIIRSLNDGKNIILNGKFGIGRTRLIKEIARLVDERKFIFVDFSQTPGTMSETLMKALGIPRRIKNQENKMRYKSMRYRIANANTAKQHKPVIVLDNTAKNNGSKENIPPPPDSGTAFSIHCRCGKLSAAERFVGS
jgi:MoxR-like ATPase